jgi:hypothetical protein
VIVDEVETGLVEQSTGMSLSNSKTNGIGKTLPKWTSCDLNAGSIVRFRMTRSDAVNLL